MGQKVTYNPAELAALIRKDIESQGLEVVCKIEVSASLQWGGHGMSESQEARVDTVEVSVKPRAAVFRPSINASQLNGDNMETQGEYLGTSSGSYNDLDK